MSQRADDTQEARFAAYVEQLVSVIGHADRAAPLRDYCTGLLLPAERKSVEPIAAVTAPARVAAQHIIEPPLQGLDDDAAGRLRGRKVHDLTRTGRGGYTRAGIRP